MGGRRRVLQLFSALGLLFFVLIFTGNSISSVQAAIPEVINYQGRLKNTSDVPLSGQYDFQFRLYTDSGATTLVWGPQEFSNLTVTNGYFSAQLGPFGLNFEDQYYLTIQVKEHSAGDWDDEATPAVPFATTPYAFKAKSLYAENEDISLQTTIAGNILMQPAGNVQISTNTDSAAMIVNQLGSGDLLNIQSNGSTQFVIDENGNVGVGTSSPNYAMEIYGDINVSGGSYLLNGVPLASVGAGTVTGTTLTWDGTGWVENTNVQTTSDGNLDIAGILQAGSSNINLTLASGMIDPSALSINSSNLMVNGSTQLDTVQDISVTASPTFADLTLSNLTTAGIVKNDASGNLIGGQTIAASEVASSGIIEGSGISLGGNLNSRILGSGSDLTISVGGNVPTSILDDTNLTGSIDSNVLTLAWQGILGIDRGGTGNNSYSLDEILIYDGSSLVSSGTTIADLSSNQMPAGIAFGNTIYYDGTTWSTGNFINNDETNAVIHIGDYLGQLNGSYLVVDDVNRLIRLDADSINLAVYSSLDINIDAGSASALITDNRVTATGLQYAGDYSATYTDRSLIDKAYADSLLSAGGELPYDGANGDTLYFDGTSWLATGNLYNDGTSVGIGTITPGYNGAILTIEPDTSTADDWFHALDILDPDMTAVGVNMMISLGRGIDNDYNDGQIYFHYDGDGSTNNYLGLGLAYQDDIMILNGNGYVGIGTTAPTNKLHVVGAITISQATPATTTDALYSVGGQLYWNGNNLSNGTSKWTSGTGTNIYRDSGNVGIGASNPQSALHIRNESAGDQQIVQIDNNNSVYQGLYIPEGSNVLVWDFNLTGDGGGIEFDNYGSEVAKVTAQGIIVNDDGNNYARLRVEGLSQEYLLYTDPANNRVGINTDSISDTLTVNGTGLIAGHAAIGADASVDPDYYGTTQTVLAVMDTLTDWSADMGMGTYTSVNLNPTTTSDYSVYGTLTDIATTAGNTVNISDVSASTGTVWHNSSATIDTATGGYYGVVNNETGNINWGTGLTATVGNNSTGSISLAYGLTTDVYNYVGGSIGSAYGLSTGIRNMGTGTIGNAYGLYVNSLQNGSGTVNNDYGIYIADQNGLATVSYNIYSAGLGKNYFGGNVGIGTTSMTNMLHVVGGITINEGSSVTTTNALYNIGGTLYWNGTALGGGGESLWSLVGAGPDIYRSSGNVGIGTSTAPLAKLQLTNSSSGDKEMVWLSNGDAVNHRVYIPDGSNILVWDFNPWDDGGAIQYDNYGTEMVKINGQGLVVNDDQTATTRLRVEGLSEEYLLYTDPATSRVGIGTNSLSDTLTVDGTGLIAGHVGIGGDASVDPSYFGGTTQTVLAVMDTLTDWSADMGMGMYTSVTLNPTIASDYSVYGALTDIATTSGNIINISDLSAQSASVWHNSSATVGTATGGGFSVVNIEAGTIDWTAGLSATVGNNSTGLITSANGLTTDVYNYINGTITSATGISTGIRNMGTGTIGSAYGLYIASLQNNSGTVNNNYGIYIADQANKATQNFGLYSAGLAKSYFGGNVGIGTTNPTQLLDVNGNAQVQDHLSIGSGAIVDQDVLSQTAQILSNARETVISTTKDVVLGYYGNIILNPAAEFTAKTVGIQSDVYTTYTNNFNVNALTGYETNIYHPSNGVVASARGVDANIINYYSGGMTNATAGQFSISNQGSSMTTAEGLAVELSNTNSADITSLTGIIIGLTNSGTSTIDSYTGIRIDSPTILTSATIGTAYGLYIANQDNTATTNSYNIYSEGSAKNFIGGSLGIGVTNPTYHLEVDGSIGLRTGSFNFIDEDDSDRVSIQIPNNLTTTTVYTLPTADGEQGESLITDGTGQLSWSRSSTAREISSDMKNNMRSVNTSMAAYMSDHGSYPACDTGTSGWYLDEFELAAALTDYGPPSGRWDSDSGNTAMIYYFCDTDTGAVQNYNLVWRFNTLPTEISDSESAIATALDAYYAEKASTVSDDRAGELYATLDDVDRDMGMSYANNIGDVWPYSGYRYVYYTNDAKTQYWQGWVARTYLSTMTSSASTIVANYLDDASRMTLNAAYNADDNGLGRRIWADQGAIEIYSSLAYVSGSSRMAGGIAIYQSASTEDTDNTLASNDQAAFKIDNTGNIGKGLYLYSNTSTSGATGVGDDGLAVLYAANTNYTLDVLRVINYGSGDGMSIQQEAANSNVLTYKDSGVSHGLSSIADDDAFARQLELWSNAGGLRIDAITDGDETVSSAMQINAYLRDTADTTSNNTTSTGVLVMNGAQHNGGGSMSGVADGGNLLTIENNDAARVIVKGNGDVLADGTFSSGGIDLAEYFEAEETVTAGGLVGLNLETGLVRNYQSGDRLVGIQSTNPAFIGGDGLTGGETNSVLVGLIGQFESIPNTLDENGSIYTEDKEYIVGYRLTNGKILLNITNWSELAKWQSELLASVEVIKTRLTAVETKTQNIQADDEGMILGGATRIDNLSVTLDTAILGKLTSNGGLTVTNEAEFKGIIRTNDQISGRAVLVKNTTEIEVERTWTEEPLSIQITPTFNAKAWIENISKDGFTIVVDNAQAEDKDIHWLAVFGPSQTELTSP